MKYPTTQVLALFSWYFIFFLSFLEFQEVNKTRELVNLKEIFSGLKFEVQIKGVMLGKYDTVEEALEVRDKNLEILQPYAYESYKFKPSS